MMWQFGELGYGYGNAGEQCLNEASYCPSIAPDEPPLSPSDGIIGKNLNAMRFMKHGPIL